MACFLPARKIAAFQLKGLLPETIAAFQRKGLLPETTKIAANRFFQRRRVF
jgi:hypothetical protein